MVAVLTCVRGFLMVVLICRGLVSGVPFLVFFDLVQHEYSLPLEILFLKVGPV